MLTTGQIIKCYREGVEIKFKRKRCEQGWKGEYNPSSLEILIYMPEIEGQGDRDLTILHEFAHAVEDCNLSAARSLDFEDEYYEEIAIKTYCKKPWILEFIKELYDIT